MGRFSWFEAWIWPEGCGAGWLLSVQNHYMFVTSWTVCVGANQPQGFGKPSFLSSTFWIFHFGSSGACTKSSQIYAQQPTARSSLGEELRCLFLCTVHISAVSYYWLTWLDFLFNTRAWSTWIKPHPSVHTQTVDSHVCQSSLSSSIS